MICPFCHSHSSNTRQPFHIKMLCCCLWIDLSFMIGSGFSIVKIRHKINGLRNILICITVTIKYLFIAEFYLRTYGNIRPENNFPSISIFFSVRSRNGLILFGLFSTLITFCFIDSTAFRFTSITIPLLLSSFTPSRMYPPYLLENEATGSKTE